MEEKPELKPCRDAFENWYNDPDNSRGIKRSDTNPDGYHLMQAQLAWIAWQACWSTRASDTEIAALQEHYPEAHAALLNSSRDLFDPTSERWW